MKKFSNVACKINEIRNVFSSGETLKGAEITNRLKSRGYKVKEANIRMFIYHRMLYKHLSKVSIKGINQYTLIY